MNKPLLLGLCSAACLFVAGLAKAQESAVDKPSAPGSTEPGPLSEIIVEAQKRSENLQAIPIAISVISAEQIDRLDLTNIENIQLAVPSLNVTNTVSRLTLSLRGIGSATVNPGFENPVAVYVDGVYLVNAAASILSFNNIAQISVLKGPQGTLYGRNATGGLIQITTPDPTYKPSGKLDISYGNFGTTTGNLYLADGLTDNLRGDVAVHLMGQSSGWGENEITDRDVYRVDHDLEVRSKWIYEPASTTKVTVIGDYTNTRDSLDPSMTQPGSFSAFRSGPQPDTGYNIYADDQPLHTLQEAGVSARIQQELASVTFVSLTAFRQSHSNLDFDIGGTAPDDYISVLQIQKDRQFSQELTLNSDSNDRLKWSTGLYFLTARDGFEPYFFRLNELDFQEKGDGFETTRSIAGYAQATYALDDKTNLTLGGRFTNERRALLDSPFSSGLISTGSLTSTVFPAQSVSASKFNYRAAIDRQVVDRVLVYGSVSTGFKSGGFNVEAPTSPAFKPETLTAYEVGLKSEFLDRAVRLNVAGFYDDYKDIQVQAYQDLSLNIINGASARTYGIDGDLTARVAPDLTVTASGSVVSAKFRKFPGCLVGSALGGTAIMPGDCSGNSLPLATPSSFSLSADYSTALAGGTLDSSASLYYSGGFYTEADNIIHQSEYAKVAAELAWRSADNHYDVMLFGRNLNDRRVLTYGATFANGTHLIQYAEPRIFGIKLSYRF
jgi:iron complex outermembrane receptor protein